MTETNATRSAGDGIKEGDLVSVDFNGAQFTPCHEAKVLHRPCQTGEPWLLRSTATGSVYYVGGCTVTKAAPSAV
jgi:hypothetical protein